MWNPIVVGSFMGVLLLTLLIPWFWLNLLLLLAAAIAADRQLYRHPQRGQLSSHQHVLTKAHLRFKSAELINKFGGKMSTEAADPNVGGVPVKVYGRGSGDAASDGARLIAARQTNGLPLARKVIFQGLKSRASAVVLDYSPATVAIRYLVDGVWMPQEPLERRRRLTLPSTPQEIFAG